MRLDTIAAKCGFQTSAGQFSTTADAYNCLGRLLMAVDGSADALVTGKQAVVGNSIVKRLRHHRLGRLIARSADLADEKKLERAVFALAEKLVAIHGESEWASVLDTEFNLVRAPLQPVASKRKQSSDEIEANPFGTKSKLGRSPKLIESATATTRTPTQAMDQENRNPFASSRSNMTRTPPQNVLSTASQASKRKSADASTSLLAPVSDEPKRHKTASLQTDIAAKLAQLNALSVAATQSYEPLTQMAGNRAQSADSQFGGARDTSNSHSATQSPSAHEATALSLDDLTGDDRNVDETAVGASSLPLGLQSNSLVYRTPPRLGDSALQQMLAQSRAGGSIIFGEGPAHNVLRSLLAQSSVEQLESALADRLPTPPPQSQPARSTAATATIAAASATAATVAVASAYARQPFKPISSSRTSTIPSAVAISAALSKPAPVTAVSDAGLRNHTADEAIQAVNHHPHRSVQPLRSSVLKEQTTSASAQVASQPSMPPHSAQAPHSNTASARPPMPTPASNAHTAMPHGATPPASSHEAGFGHPAQAAAPTHPAAAGYGHMFAPPSAMNGFPYAHQPPLQQPYYPYGMYPGAAAGPGPVAGGWQMPPASMWPMAPAPPAWPYAYPTHHAAAQTAQQPSLQEVLRGMTSPEIKAVRLLEQRRQEREDTHRQAQLRQQLEAVREAFGGTMEAQHPVRSLHSYPHHRNSTVGQPDGSVRELEVCYVQQHVCFQRALHSVGLLLDTLGN